MFSELVKIYQSENLLRNNDRLKTNNSSSQINSDLIANDTFSSQKNPTEILIASSQLLPGIVAQNDSNLSQESLLAQNTTDRETNATIIRQTAPVQLDGKQMGIAINPQIQFAVQGTKVVYSFNQGFSIPNDRSFQYRWEVHNDIEALERYRSSGLLNQLNPFAREVLPGPQNSNFEVNWDLEGKHTVFCYLYIQGQLTKIFQYVQDVRSLKNTASSQFKNQPPQPLQPDLYVSVLEAQKHFIDAEKNPAAIEKLDKAVENSREKLGITDREPAGNSYPLKATLVPQELPDRSFELQLYLRPLTKERWAIVDLTDPAANDARIYVASPDLALLPAARKRDTIRKAWRKFIEKNPHPAGQIVAEIPQELKERAEFPLDETWNDPSFGVAGLEYAEEWLRAVALGTGLGGLALGLSNPKAGIVKVLWVISGISAAGSGGLNIADRLEHGNFQWDGETALDLVDLAGGLASATGAVIQLADKAAQVTQLRSAVLISEGIELGSEITGGVILAAGYYQQIQEINRTVEDPEERKKQIEEVLRAAALAGGLIVLGFIAGSFQVRPGKKGKGGINNQKVETSSTTYSGETLEATRQRVDLESESLPTPKTPNEAQELLQSQIIKVQNKFNAELDITEDTLFKIQDERNNLTKIFENERKDLLARINNLKPKLGTAEDKAAKNLIGELEDRLRKLPTQQTSRREELDSAINTLNGYKTTLNVIKNDVNKIINEARENLKFIDEEASIVFSDSEVIAEYQLEITKIQNIDRDINEIRAQSLQNGNVLAREIIYGENTFIEIERTQGNKNQRLYRRLADQQEYVIDSTGQKIPRYVYRNISQKDNKNLGSNSKRQGDIEGKNPGFNTTPFEHSSGAEKTPWISTTKIRGEIYNPKGDSFNRYGKVKIDLLGIDPKNIVDVSTKQGLINNEFPLPVSDELSSGMQATRDAIRTQEVVVKDRIPGNLIQRLPRN
ncbi:MAG: hypothetical protein QNJ38_23760 [Prochloraceae cyanobacterium]|nr:hypothetical protein [Prochloraceae cyanobacterium]